MKHLRLLRLTCAAYLLLCAASFAYRAAAATVHDISAGSGHAQTATPRPCLLLHGKRLFTLAGYEVNASFTPGGKFHSFELVSSKR
ncbi:MAG TPA: hypothetical protein VF064_10295 [Pyrinomonadaceae bacterium]